MSEIERKKDPWRSSKVLKKCRIAIDFSTKLNYPYEVRMDEGAMNLMCISKKYGLLFVSYLNNIFVYDIKKLNQLQNRKKSKQHDWSKKYLRVIEQTRQLEYENTNTACGIYEELKREFSKYKYIAPLPELIIPFMPHSQDFLSGSYHIRDTNYKLIKCEESEKTGKSLLICVGASCSTIVYYVDKIMELVYLKRTLKKRIFKSVKCIIDSQNLRKFKICHTSYIMHPTDYLRDTYSVDSREIMKHIDFHLNNVLSEMESSDSSEEPSNLFQRSLDTTGRNDIFSQNRTNRKRESEAMLHKTSNELTYNAHNAETSFKNVSSNWKKKVTNTDIENNENTLSYEDKRVRNNKEYSNNEDHTNKISFKQPNLEKKNYKKQRRKNKEYVAMKIINNAGLELCNCIKIKEDQVDSFREVMEYAGSELINFKDTDIPELKIISYEEKTEEMEEEINIIFAAEIIKNREKEIIRQEEKDERDLLGALIEIRDNLIGKKIYDPNEPTEWEKRKVIEQLEEWERMKELAELKEMQRLKPPLPTRVRSVAEELEELKKIMEKEETEETEETPREIEETPKETEEISEESVKPKFLINLTYYLTEQKKEHIRKLDRKNKNIVNLRDINMSKFLPKKEEYKDYQRYKYNDLDIDNEYDKYEYDIYEDDNYKNNEYKNDEYEDEECEDDEEKILRMEEEETNRLLGDLAVTRDFLIGKKENKRNQEELKQPEKEGTLSYYLTQRKKEKLMHNIKKKKEKTQRRKNTKREREKKRKREMEKIKEQWEMKDIEEESANNKEESYRNTENSFTEINRNLLFMNNAHEECNFEKRECNDYEWNCEDFIQQFGKPIGYINSVHQKKKSIPNPQKNNNRKSNEIKYCSQRKNVFNDGMKDNDANDYMMTPYSENVVSAKEYEVPNESSYSFDLFCESCKTGFCSVYIGVSLNGLPENFEAGQGRFNYTNFFKPSHIVRKLRNEFSWSEPNENDSCASNENFDSSDDFESFHNNLYGASSLISDVRTLTQYKRVRGKVIDWCIFCKSLLKDNYPDIGVSTLRIYRNPTGCGFEDNSKVYQDPILKAVHMNIYPDIVFFNYMGCDFDNSTWSASFDFENNLLAVGSNTHLIHVYHTGGFYYFRKKYTFREAIELFKNFYRYKKVELEDLFPSLKKKETSLENSEEEGLHSGKNKNTNTNTNIFDNKYNVPCTIKKNKLKMLSAHVENTEDTKENPYEILENYVHGKKRRKRKRTSKQTQEQKHKGIDYSYFRHIERYMKSRKYYKKSKVPITLLNCLIANKKILRNGIFILHGYLDATILTSLKKYLFTQTDKQVLKTCVLSDERMWEISMNKLIEKSIGHVTKPGWSLLGRHGIIWNEETLMQSLLNHIPSESVRNYTMEKFYNYLTEVFRNAIVGPMNIIPSEQEETRYKNINKKQRKQTKRTFELLDETQVDTVIAEQLSSDEYDNEQIKFESQCMHFYYMDDLVLFPRKSELINRTKKHHPYVKEYKLYKNYNKAKKVLNNIISGFRYFVTKRHKGLFLTEPMRSSSNHIYMIQGPFHEKQNKCYYISDEEESSEQTQYRDNYANEKYVTNLKNVVKFIQENLNRRSGFNQQKNTELEKLEQVFKKIKETENNVILVYELRDHNNNVLTSIRMKFMTSTSMTEEQISVTPEPIKDNSPSLNKDDHVTPEEEIFENINGCITKQETTEKVCLSSAMSYLMEQEIKMLTKMSKMYYTIQRDDTVPPDHALSNFGSIPLVKSRTFNNCMNYYMSKPKNYMDELYANSKKKDGSNTGQSSNSSQMQSSKEESSYKRMDTCSSFMKDNENKNSMLKREAMTVPELNHNISSNSSNTIEGKPGLLIGNAIEPAILEETQKQSFASKGKIMSKTKEKKFYMEREKHNMLNLNDLNNLKEIEADMTEMDMLKRNMVLIKNVYTLSESADALFNKENIHSTLFDIVVIQEGMYVTKKNHVGINEEKQFIKNSKIKKKKLKKKKVEQNLYSDYSSISDSSMSNYFSSSSDDIYESPFPCSQECDFFQSNKNTNHFCNRSTYGHYQEYPECTECYYHNMCLTNTSTINALSVYAFLQNNHTIMFAKDYHIHMCEDETRASSFELVKKSKKKQRKYPETNQDIHYAWEDRKRENKQHIRMHEQEKKNKKKNKESFKSTQLVLLDYDMPYTLEDISVDNVYMHIFTPIQSSKKCQIYEHCRKKKKRKNIKKHTVQGTWLQKLLNQENGCIVTSHFCRRKPVHKKNKKKRNLSCSVSTQEIIQDISRYPERSYLKDLINLGNGRIENLFQKINLVGSFTGNEDDDRVRCLIRDYINDDSIPPLEVSQAEWISEYSDIILDHYEKLAACPICLHAMSLDKNNAKKSRKLNQQNDKNPVICKEIYYDISSLLHKMGQRTKNKFYTLYHSKAISCALFPIYTGIHLKKLKEIKSFQEHMIMADTSIGYYSADWYDVLFKAIKKRIDKPTLLLNIHSHNVPCVKFSPDYKFLLSCSIDKTVALWFKQNLNSPFGSTYDQQIYPSNFYDHIVTSYGNFDTSSFEANPNDKWFLNAISSIDVHAKGNVFAREFEKTQLWNVKMEQKLMTTKSSINVCRHTMETYGWSVDFIEKKNITSYDFLDDALFKGYPFSVSENKFSYINPLDDNSNLYKPSFMFRKYALLHLFSLSFLNMENSESGDGYSCCEIIKYLREAKEQMIEERANFNKNMRLTLEWVMKKEDQRNLESEQTDILKRNHLHSRMKYISKGLMKPYIFAKPMNTEKSLRCYHRHPKNDEIFVYDVLSDYDYANTYEIEWEADSQIGSTSDEDDDEEEKDQARRNRQNKTIHKKRIQNFMRKKKLKMHCNLNLFQKKENSKNRNLSNWTNLSIPKCGYCKQRHYRCKRCTNTNEECIRCFNNFIYRPNRMISKELYKTIYEGTPHLYKRNNPGRYAINNYTFDYDEETNKRITETQEKFYREITEHMENRNRFMRSMGESDEEYANHKKYSSSIFYKNHTINTARIKRAITSYQNECPIRGQFQLCYDILKQQYIDLMFLGPIYKHMKNVILLRYINKYLKKKPKCIHFNFYIAESYKDAKELKDMIHFFAESNTENAGPPTSVKEKRFRTFLQSVNPNDDKEKKKKKNQKRKDMEKEKEKETMKKKSKKMIDHEIDILKNVEKSNLKTYEMKINETKKRARLESKETKSNMGRSVRGCKKNKMKESEKVIKTEEDFYNHIILTNEQKRKQHKQKIIKIKEEEKEQQKREREREQQKQKQKQKQTDKLQTTEWGPLRDELKEKNKKKSKSGYTIILKNNVQNLHNVIHNIISISSENKILKHHKHFIDNGMYYANKKKRKTTEENHVKNIYKSTQKKEHVLKEYVNKFKYNYDSDKSVRSFNSHSSEEYHRRKKEKMKIKKKMQSQKNHKQNKTNIRRNTMEKKNKINIRNPFFYFKKGKSIRTNHLMNVVNKEKKKYNICFLNPNDKYKIEYSTNMNILQSLYKYCGEGLILVNVQYVKNEEMLHKQNKENLSIDTNIFVCNEIPDEMKPTNFKNYVYKKRRNIIFVVKINVSPFKNYLLRKTIFTKKYIETPFYVNLKIVKIMYFAILKNYAMIPKYNDSTCNERLLDRVKSMEPMKYRFFNLLTQKLFKWDKEKKLQKTIKKEKEQQQQRHKKNILFLDQRNIYALMTYIVHHIFNINATINMNNRNYGFEFEEIEELKKYPGYDELFRLFFSGISEKKKHILMLNIAVIRFLYSHMKFRHFNKEMVKKFRRNNEWNVFRKCANDNMCCTYKDQEHIPRNLISKEGKKSLDNYLLIAGDITSIYLFKVKCTKITKNIYSTKMVQLGKHNFRNLTDESLRKRRNTGYNRVSFLRVIYEQSCLIIADPYINEVSIFFVKKCNYTNTYFLLHFVNLHIYESPICFNHHKYDFLRGAETLGEGGQKRNQHEICVCEMRPLFRKRIIAGLDVVYTKEQNNKFNLKICALLENSVIHSYSIDFNYY